MFHETSNPLSIVRRIVEPWHDSLKDPLRAQEQVLLELNKGYRKTRHGRGFAARDVKSFVDFRDRFPILDYQKLTPFLAQIHAGDYKSILPEPLECWVMTRGSTGPAKILPATRRHLGQIFTCGPRALVNHALRKRDLDLVIGNLLNLNFPSIVHATLKGRKKMTYGYSSGTYARLNPVLGRVGLIPRQEDIDVLGPGIARSDWAKRFELVYNRAQGQNVTATIGVAPIILAFARYLTRKHGVKPKDLWNFKALFCTSVKKIPFRYAPILRYYFGEIPVVEIYSAAEGVFAQQLDDMPYVSPNYDNYLFEVDTGKETKMLHELKRGEWGKLIVSTRIFPRYNIGDLIEAEGKNYFRVIGRDNRWTLTEHMLYRLIFRWFL